MTARNIGLALALLVSLGLIVWVARRPTPDAPKLTPAPAASAESSHGSMPADRRAARDKFFKADVQPRIVSTDSQNREAAERCLARLKETFEGYRTGIQPFCKEINTWGTRLGVVRRMPSDWWYEKTDVNDYIQAKFGKHLFTDKKLTEDINRALAQFRADIEANQNSMVTDIRAAISTRDLPGLPTIEYSEFAKDLSERLEQYSAQSAKDSVTSGIVTEVASGLGGLAAEQLLAQLVVRLTAMVGTSTASAGGATAGGAAVGGGGGAFGGPVGVAAGLAVGLVVGGVIDWWLSGSFEAKMTAQLNKLIDELGQEVISGAPERPGLRQGLYDSCDIIRQAQEKALRSRIIDGSTL